MYGRDASDGISKGIFEILHDFDDDDDNGDHDDDDHHHHNQSSIIISFIFTIIISSLSCLQALQLIKDRDIENFNITIFDWLQCLNERAAPWYQSWSGDQSH